MMLEIAFDSDEEWDSSTAPLGGWEQLVRRAADAAIRESAFPQLATSDQQVEISVRLADDDEVQALNRSWRGKDKPTNVLSFPMMQAAELQTSTFAGAETLLGDIILARGVCEAEAEQKNIGVETHAAHLVVHGTLHLLGYDHHGDDEAADMEAREIRALARLGIANPYEVTA